MFPGNTAEKHKILFLPLPVRLQKGETGSFLMPRSLRTARGNTKKDCRFQNTDAVSPFCFRTDLSRDSPAKATAFWKYKRKTYGNMSCKIILRSPSLHDFIHACLLASGFLLASLSSFSMPHYRSDRNQRIRHQWFMTGLPSYSGGTAQAYDLIPS